MTKYGQLSDETQERELSVDFLALDPSCFSGSYFCTHDCEQYQLFNTGWQEGVAQAQQLFEHMDLEHIEEIGRAAGFTSRRPLAIIAIVYAERDGAEAKLHGEALKRFISGWRQTGGDRRRIKGGVVLACSHVSESIVW